MSGMNANGYAESRRLLLGLGDLYINNEFVGNLKDAVTLTVTREYAYQRAGNNIADQKGEVTREEVSLEASICDLKLGQLRKAFGIDKAVDTSTAKALRQREVLKLAGVTPVAPAETIASGLVVSKLDRKKIYALTTDYILSGGSIRRATSGSTITDGESVIAEYTFSDTGAQSLAMGGETKSPNTFRMDFTHKDSSGKLWQITFFRAMSITEFEMAFNERESGDFTMHGIKFRALVDTTLPEGQNMMEIVQEDATA